MGLHGPKKGPQIDPLWATDSTKYQNIQKLSEHCFGIQEQRTQMDLHRQLMETHGP